MGDTSAAARGLLWGNLIHLSLNMWCDRDAPECGSEYVWARPYLRFDDSLWEDLLPRMAAAGINAVVLDLGDGIRYESHPEIAVEGAWTPARLQEELVRMRAMGLEPIPKLNFSTAHDAWMGEYSRCVSSRAYYDVCRDLIGEVAALFGTPHLFHLGMDEETFEHQQHYAYAVVRQHELWWHDLRFLVEQVERHGSRAWVWSDYVWHHPDAFYANMPRSVVQSNWYYDASFDPASVCVKAYLDLEAHGYDQIPTGSNWSNDANFERTVQFCREHIGPKRLLGFLQTPWRPTLEACQEVHFQAVEQVERARRMAA